MRKHISYSILLGRDVHKRPDMQSYAVRYFSVNKSPFEFLDTEDLAKKARYEEDQMPADIDIVEACYFLLKTNPDFYRNRWNWSCFMKLYSNHRDPRVRWICCKTLAILLGLSRYQIEKIVARKLSVEEHYEFECTFLTKSTLRKHSDRIVQIDEDRVKIDPLECTSISGVYVPVVAKPRIPSHLIMVPSTVENLRKVALGICSNKAVCLQGPVGSGKTSLVEHLSIVTGRVLGENFLKVQLGDQTDSKMLLGTYRCTDIPGEFVWQPGVLTQAVVDGLWLLLEDIDSASMDIASVLTSLLENRSLTVPGYRDAVPIAPGFQLFVTRRYITTLSGHHKKHSNAMAVLGKHLMQIQIDSLSNTELKTILNLKHEAFKTITERMISVFELFCHNKNNPNEISIPKTNRIISTRDFFKWCSRAIIDFDVSSQASALKVLQDAIDVFCCSYPDTVEALELAKQISTHLGIINHKAEYFFKNYKPSMRLTSGYLVAGRITFKRENNQYSKPTRYSFTRPSLVLLERIMCCVSLREPVLLVGETGTGKTYSVQFLADTIGKKLVVINMNQQSDSADLLGGFKPVNMKFVVGPVRREFERLFCDFFQVEPNRKYLSNIAMCFNNQRWYDLVKLMMKSQQAAISRLTKSIDEFESSVSNLEAKRDKYKRDQEFLASWRRMGDKLLKLNVQVKQKSALAFAFIEGSLVRAVENGYWVLLDEINLANAETLECLSGLLEGNQGSLCLLERGDRKPVHRHPDFTLFACMNPSTDVGKKDLPSGLRNRFTEFYVDELTDKSDLLLLVNNYLEAMSLKQKDLENIVNFYIKIRTEMKTSLMDGLGHKPHFSLRSLCRALVIASKNPCGVFKRSLYEAFCLSFLTQLDSNSYKLVEKMIAKYLIGDEKSVKAILKQPIPEPDTSGDKYLQFEGYWVKTGSLEPQPPSEYILTESVRRNLKDLVRVVSIGKLPVLLQGDTSVGKTSLITYLAKSSGNKCVRINNHEHTDLQEYIGSYVADLEGKLVFREGLLVEAMRKGHWIILDELNLAPTDVLEALNRVLDDNRELFIPETQETVQADPNFMLFATQNPPGAYGGRKMLSRAFRNRFVELHFNEIPPNELETILHQRCEMPSSYAKKMVNVMSDLQIRRRGSAAFAGKQGFITLRDLFRWGERYRLAKNPQKLYDWDQHLADEGYLVLAGRVRKLDEKQEIIEVLRKNLKREVVPDNLFTLSEKTSSVTRSILEKIHENSNKHANIVWTYNMRQLAVLTAKAMHFKEPVLLIGETGGGKTTVCQLIADNNGQQLLTVNCHMHTESSDFIGGLRPVRDHTSNDSTKLFEWMNGPLIQAMQDGCVFLADEISLADDSVLERLNSLLEPERSLLLAEKGIDLNNRENAELIVAHPEFYFVGTMNPGGDFGKKELSPALRNRFTEIWCEPCEKRQDLIAIVERNIKCGLSMGNQEDATSGIGNSIMDFVEWFGATEVGRRFTISIRDIITWVHFMNNCSKHVDITEAYIHGACLTFLDSLGSGVTSTESLKFLSEFRCQCEGVLRKQVEHLSPTLPASLSSTALIVGVVDNKFGINPFFIERNASDVTHVDFAFNTPQTVFNLQRLLRGMQLNKAILLEGSPGVGKTSLVMALAQATGHELYRVNLSDQTDISDLFGADLPVEGGTGGQFSWRDGPLLQALKRGSWILLDELNLASQSVLEGLNACLDHRGEIFIPELGKTFHVKTGTRFFGCQNPLKQGGSRRGLPRSFLNRFIQVYVHSLTSKDLHYILSNKFKQIPKEIISKIIEFNSIIDKELEKHTFGSRGSPWECNLRDLTRWCEAMLYHRQCNKLDITSSYMPESVVKLIYADRMRTVSDKNRVREVFESVFGCDFSGMNPLAYVTSTQVYLGDVRVQRKLRGINTNVMKQNGNRLVLRSQLEVLRSLAYCVNLKWISILVGGAGSGKSSVVKTLANLAGKTLKTLPVTSAMDTTDLLGGFEQTDYNRHLEEIIRCTEFACLEIIYDLLEKGQELESIEVMSRWESFKELRDSAGQTMDEEMKLFLRKSDKLQLIISNLKSYVANTGMLETMEQKLEEITSAVSREKSLNAGGKFEWVDSILIKCLRNGDWLLIDNVNLCSSAVLDRLNALLEPNGVLTLSERGVNEDGKVIEIKPHEDFRLFMSMDPKNGEISRAMRNRGIEIFLLNENESNHVNEYDRMSLIYSEGLTQHRKIQTLLEIHRFVAENIVVEKPQLIELLQTASLMAQMDSYVKNSNVMEAAVEVYCKTRSSHEFSLKDIKSQILNWISIEDEKIFSHTMTLDTNSIESQGFLSVIQQQAVFLNKYYENLDLLVFLVANYYAIGSPENLNLRNFYLLNHPLFPSRMLAESCYQVAVKAIKGAAINHLPLDLHWVPDSSIQVSKKHSVRLLMALYVEVFYYMEKFAALVKKETTQSGKKDLLSCLQLKQKKKLLDYIDDVIAKYFLRLIKLYDEYIFHIAKTVKTIQLSDVISILNLLLWRFNMYKSIVITAKMSSNEIYNVVMSLRLHYKWFHKYALAGISAITHHPIPAQLKAVVQTLNSDLYKQFSLLQKVGKRFTKCSNPPKPFTEPLQLEMVTLFNTLLQLCDVCDTNSDPIKALNMFHTDKELRNSLVEMNLKFADNTEYTLEKINMLESLLEKYKETVNEEKWSTFDLQLFPLLDHINQLKMRNNPNPDDMRNNILVPIDMSAIVYRLANESNQCLRHEFTKCYHMYLMYSASTRPAKYFGSNETSGFMLSTFNPKITYFMNKLLVNVDCSDNLAVINLGNYRDIIKQYNQLGNILWGNFEQLCDGRYDYIRLESEQLKKMYHHMILDLYTSLNIPLRGDESFHQLTIQLYEIVSKKVTDLPLTDTNHDMVNLLDHLKYTRSLFLSMDNEKNVSVRINAIAELYMRIGYFKAQLFAQIPLVDPKEKKGLRRKYCLEAIQLFENMKLSYELQNMVYTDRDKPAHELYGYIVQHLVKLQEELKELDKFVAVRPIDASYRDLRTSINHAFSTILSKSHIATAISTLDKHLDALLSMYTDQKREVNREVAINNLKMHKASLSNYETLIHSWKKFRNSYPDIIEPLLGSVAEFMYGFRMKLSLTKKLLINHEHWKMGIKVSQLISLVKLPILDEKNHSYEEYINCLTKPKMIKFTEHVLQDPEHPQVGFNQKLRLIKCALQESFNHCILACRGNDLLPKNLFFVFSNLMAGFIESWNKQQEEKEAKLQEAESLYKTKAKCNDKSEEEQFEDELKELFPNHHDIDFADFQRNQSNKDDDEPEIKISPEETISYDDLKFVVLLHSTLVKDYTNSEWLNPVRNKNIHPDFVTPILEKNKIFGNIFVKKIHGLEYSMDNKLIGSMSVMLAAHMKHGDLTSLADQASPVRIINKTRSDFYKDSNVDEVKSCYHILEELRIKINELLQEWPEQPTLKTIISIIERIYNFDIKSPVSRFLTGFEILLSKCHEWEQVAHSGVSLSQFYQSLTEQIIVWRKLELAMWKDLLNRTYDRLNEPMAKWWLYMYNIMKQFIIDKTITSNELIETMQSFITKSNLAEFKGRLDLLYVFHCHATYLERTQESAIFINILWNLYSYFDQFSLSIANKIKDLRSPIEKKLKDYVKIVKWKDISYWAVKETVDKSHKILHKYMREFREVLEQPVTPCLTNIEYKTEIEGVGIWDRPQRQNPKTYHYTLDAESYMAKLSLTKKKVPYPFPLEEGIFTKMESYFLKSRKLCRDTILASEYPNLIKSLDGFVAEIIETSTHLQQLEVDTTLTKEKQKSQAKQILQQKHRALADLFKSLSKIGLSFRTGIIQSKLKKHSDDFVMKPIDLSANLNHLNNGRNEEKIVTMWNNCELYYLRSLLRADILETALKNPAKDLGLQNIERCKGFSAHLLDFAQKQKSQLIESSRLYYYIRYYLKQMYEACEGKDCAHTTTAQRMLNVLKNVSIVMSQYKIILNSCPADDNIEIGSSIETPILESRNPDVISHKHDRSWTKAMGLINKITASVMKLTNLVVKCKGLVPSVEYDLVAPHYVLMSDALSVLNDFYDIHCYVEELQLVMGNITMTDSLTWLMKELMDIVHCHEPRYPDYTINEYKIGFKEMSEKVLLVIQNIYKKYSSSEKNQDNNDENDVDNDDQLKEGHLKTHLIDSLSADLKILEMKEVLDCTHKIAEMFLKSPTRLGRETALALHCLPILEQIAQMYQYFITQQVAAYRVTCKMNSILLNIFIELTSKGFCVPPEFSDEMDEEGVSKPSDGLGLGEGQGERDVSDKIESEDQLDDAQPAGQEKQKDEDKDCKEEDKGIEMSEDFDSKLQDKEKKEGDESEQESDDDNADEQMGETEKGADQLDEEIWGSDKEENDEEDEDGNDESKKEEKGDKGEKEGEDQLGAKEDRATKDDEQDGGNEEKEEKKKEINELEEPEYDDDQIDPHHGKQPELPEPEPMDLPDDLQLDDGQENDNEKPEENPFDIDAMKERNPVDEEENKEEGTEDNEEAENDEEKDFSSDDEEVKKDEKDDKETGSDAGKQEENKDELNEDSSDQKDEDVPKEKSDTSTMDQTQSNQDQVEAMETEDADAADKTDANQDVSKASQPIDELQQEDRPDKEGVGQSQMEESSTGHTAQTSAPQEMKSAKEETVDEQKSKQRPGESDSQRSLGNIDEPVRKKLKTMNPDRIEDKVNAEDDPNNAQESAEMYQHIKDGEDSKTQVLDVATEEQADNQQKEIPNKMEEEVEQPTESSDQLPPDHEEEQMDIDETTSEKPQKTDGTKEKNSKKRQHPDGDVLDDLHDIEVEGEIIETHTTARPTESTHHTSLSNLNENTAVRLTQEEINSLRVEVEKNLWSWNEPPPNEEAEQSWQMISAATASLAQDLSEQLRLVLEPTQASRLRGDFRTGRRINMRKVIPYIASQFRKDKIWLRRTKPSKREYQIVMAIDDSSSMADNHSKELAFESVALISKALTLLESGQLAVLGFGENLEVVHKLSDPFTDKCGVKLLQRFRFNQSKTCVAKLVDFATEMFKQSQGTSNALNAKLLLIVSDGRGVFSEGETFVRQAVRRAKISDIFMVFVIIDNPENKNSVLDIRMPVFKDGKLLGIKNYMDEFPFSFYIILRDINSLPTVLSDALRQWFEIVSNLDK